VTISFLVLKRPRGPKKAHHSAQPGAQNAGAVPISSLYQLLEALLQILLNFLRQNLQRKPPGKPLA
jgi:hypothetical protein